MTNATDYRSYRGLPSLAGLASVAEAAKPGATTLDLTYDNTYYNNPPPGFSSQIKMLPTPGTWKQLTN